jgi:hypothetical protein
MASKTKVTRSDSRRSASKSGTTEPPFRAVAAPAPAPSPLSSPVIPATAAPAPSSPPPPVTPAAAVPPSGTVEPAPSVASVTPSPSEAGMPKLGAPARGSRVETPPLTKAPTRKWNRLAVGGLAAAVVIVVCAAVLVFANRSEPTSVTSANTSAGATVPGPQAQPDALVELRKEVDQLRQEKRDILDRLDALVNEKAAKAAEQKPEAEAPKPQAAEVTPPTPAPSGPKKFGTAFNDLKN